MMRTASYPPSSLAFDWLMAVLAALVMAGVIQDGWAHAHGMVDQSFFTPWHAILYGCMALSGAVLGVVGLRNLTRGYSFRCGLPYGYWTSAIGVLLFASGGVFDLYWHTIFGIETDITGLISISHLWLALGGAMLFAGPIRSIAHRYDEHAGGWKIAGPLVLCTFALLTLLGFFTQYASLFGDNTDEAIMTADSKSLTGGELFSVRTDGTQETRLLTAPKHDVWGAAVSPDGTFVAYRVAAGVTSGGLAASDIYVARTDGTHPVRITHSGRHDTQPAWSPDGKHLAYVSMPAGTSGNFRIVTVNADGSNAHVAVDGSTTVQNPAWSPDGTHILFQSRNGLHQQLALVPAGGGAVRWLSGTIDANEPYWTRNGAIVYDRSDGALVLTNASGSKPAVLPLSGSEPALSPDGSRIAYVRNAGGAAQVFIAHADGSHAVNVTQLASQDASHPAWRSNNELLFTAAGRPQGVYTSMGQTYSMDAIIISSLITMGLVLLLLRRWRMPLGAFTLLLGLNGIALATQSDTYWDIPAALATGILADLLVAVLKERVRSGNAFYAFAFIVPFAMTVFYIASVRLNDGSLGWPPNMIIGAPFIAGFAGLLVSFCYAPPLPQAVSVPDEAVRAPVRQADAFTAEAARS
ncbi:MAG TPA: hypothetical protein VKT72_01595 [Candidatus Baltobacteraceae bacterium]|nr:hypothetical protein [Candidatus Baltobacteraceae bacterium]